MTTSNGITDSTQEFNENNTGNAFASFLFGQVDAAYRQQAFETRLRNFSISPYIMDNIKITPALTINVGVRYDVLVPFTADNPGNIVFLDLTKPNPGAIGANGPLLGAASSLGNGPQAAGFNRANMSWKNVGPRLGFAYQVGSKTVVSGGYGISFLDGGAYEFGTNKTANNYGNVLAGLNQTPSSGTQTANYGSWDAHKLANPLLHPSQRLSVTARVSSTPSKRVAFASPIRKATTSAFNVSCHGTSSRRLLM